MYVIYPISSVYIIPSSPNFQCYKYSMAFIKIKSPVIGCWMWCCFCLAPGCGCFCASWLADSVPCAENYNDKIWAIISWSIFRIYHQIFLGSLFKHNIGRLIITILYVYYPSCVHWGNVSFLGFCNMDINNEHISSLYEGGDNVWI